MSKAYARKMLRCPCLGRLEIETLKNTKENKHVLQGATSTFYEKARS